MKTDELLKQAEAQTNESSISAADKDFENEEAARKVFSSIKAKIINVNEWNKHALMSSYDLFDEDGSEIADEKIRIGTFLRIHLKASGKYDWVRVENIDDAPDEFIITVRPTFDPTAEKPDEKIISHFFTDESTNNFCLSRKGVKVALYVIGLNEKRNTSETGGTLETIRNVAVNFATYLGVQNGEWEKFCHHFMEDAANEK